MEVIRIYQGKVTKVEKEVNQNWQKLNNWQNILWNHHCLFQDAVNYYILILASLAYDDKANNSNSKDEFEGIVEEWAKQVENTWKIAKKKSEEFEGPHNQIAKILGLDPEKTNFKDCVEKLFEKWKQNAKAPDTREKALLSLIKEAEKKDLNIVISDNLPWLCQKELDKATSEDQKQQLEKQQPFIEKIKEAKDLNDIKKIINSLDPYIFLKKYPNPNETATEKKYKELLEGYFDEISQKYPNEIAGLKNEFDIALENYLKNQSNKLLKLGRKTPKLFRYAIILKIMPKVEIIEIFKKLIKKTKNDKNQIFLNDNIERLRTENGGQNPFEYFTNIILPKQKGKNVVAFFEFDKMAAIEAINSILIFYENTKNRKAELEKIKNKIETMNGEGKSKSNSDDEDEKIPGFKYDTRIDLIKKLVEELSKFEDSSENKKYSINERTIRGFTEIKKKWKDLLSQNQNPKIEDFYKIISEVQQNRYYSFGSAELFRKLAEREFWPIWNENGTKDYLSEDPLKSWITYTELLEEDKKKKAPIKFTPAHPTYSPRYADFPKGNSKFAVKHSENSFSFTTGIIIGDHIENLKISYSAPRLLRDEIRSSNSSNNNDIKNDARYLTPMIKALVHSQNDSLPTANFKNAKISLMAKSNENFQIVFPIEVNPNNIISLKSWQKQFLYDKEKDIFYKLKWPNEKDKKSITWTQYESFSLLSVDLGLRYAAAIARIKITKSGADNNIFIGNDGQNNWIAKVERIKTLRLPGEDQNIWMKEQKCSNNFNYIEEFYGSKGRKSTKEENEQAKEILKKLNLEESEIMPEQWEEKLSFPEQNDYLLTAVRRAQARNRRLHSWAYLLNSSDNSRKEIVFKEIKNSKYDKLKGLINNSENELKENITKQIQEEQEKLKSCLVDLTNRIIPLKGRKWVWKNHPQKNDCYIMSQEKQEMQTQIKIKGQRGLSIARIEQLTELRKRLQSLNNTLRREIGKEAPKTRDDSIPDCCPDILEKLNNIKEQRVNQTAHMILAEALGLKLKEPEKNKKIYEHGSYEKIKDKDNNWIGPVDFIVIENLSSYKTNKERTHRENSRLMTWCHRAIKNKLIELMEVFFGSSKEDKKNNPPLLEVNAAYSSQLYSKNQAPGFRAVELKPGFEKEYRWKKILSSTGKNSENLKKIKENLENYNKNNTGVPKTLIVPLEGGPIFVYSETQPNSNNPTSTFDSPKIINADINAAINIGLRAILKKNPNNSSKYKLTEDKKWEICMKINEKRIEKWNQKMENNKT